MVQFTRVQQGPAARQTSERIQDSGRTGRLNGMTVRLQPVRDVDDELLAARFRQETGLDGSLDHKALAERKFGLGNRGLALDAQSLARFSKAFATERSSAKLAQSYLRSFLGNAPKPNREAQPNELLNHFVALQQLAAALRGNDDDFVARLSPLKDGTDTLAALAEKLRDAGDDNKAIQEQLSDVEGLPEEQEQLASMMKTLRFQPDQLKRKLRDAQKLPDPDAQSRQEMLEAVEDELQELQRQHGSHFRAIDNALRNAGEDATAELAESYAELVHDERSGFARTLEKLLARHTPADLSRQIIPLMEKTLVNELGLGQDQRSIDKIKLEALLTELANIHISATLLEKTTNLVSSMRRIYGVPA